MVKAADELVVRSSIEVPLARDVAFRLFVDRLADWWPLTTHSVYEEQAVSVMIEPRVGGRIVETGPGEQTAEWGVVTEWDDPSRIAFTWYPGQDASVATLVEIGFEATEERRTRVDVVHTGWEVRGADAERAMQGYAVGWPIVLGRYQAIAEGAM